MREEVGDLGHEVDPHLGVLDAGVHVHPTDDEPIRHHAEIAGERLIPLLVRRLLFPPQGERVGGGGDDGGVVGRGHRPEVAPELSEIFGEVLDAGVGPGSHLHLGAEELGGDPLADRLVCLVPEFLARVCDQVAGRRIDQQVFLLDPDCERWSLQHAADPTGGRRSVVAWR